jgi:hypothetical protein
MVAGRRNHKLFRSKNFFLPCNHLNLREGLAAQAVFAGFGILAAAFRVSLSKLFVANNIVVLGYVRGHCAVLESASRPAQRFNPRNSRPYRRFSRLDSVRRARKSLGP